MAYQLFFDTEIVPKIRVVVPHAEWPSSFETPRDDVAASLVGSSRRPPRWFPVRRDASAFGYNGYGHLQQINDGWEATFWLNRRIVRATLVTLGFFFASLTREDRPFFELTVRCDQGIDQLICGEVSPQFKEGLRRVTEKEQEKIRDDMQKAWRDTAPGSDLSFAESCAVRIAGARFELDCHGNACNVSMYPTTDPAFCCNNVDTPYQAATLLAGLASLHAVVRSHL